MGDLRQSSVGPSGVEFGDNVSRGTLLPNTKGKVPYIGYEDRIMQEFQSSHNGRLPKDRMELNAFIKYNKPDWPMVNEAQFQEAISSFQYGEELAGQKQQQAEAAKKQTELKAIENKMASRYTSLYDSKKVREAIADKLLTVEAANFEEFKKPGVREEAEKRITKEVLDSVIRDDTPWNRLKEKRDTLQGQISKGEAGRPSPRRAAEGERPSGGGSIVVTGKPKSAKDAKQGTILTTQGAYGESKQYKFTPVDEVEEGKPYAGRYRVSRPKPGTFNTWEDGGEITADELYTRTRGDYGAPKSPAEREAPIQGLPVPPTPGGESVYEEYGMDPRMEEPIVAPEPRQALVPPGYPGIDEEYVDPYAGYQYDERDVTELGLTPRGFYRELFGY